MPISILAAAALWIFCSFFISFPAGLFANVVAPVENPRDPEQVVAHERAVDAASMVSPVVLYSEATSSILNPFLRTTKRLPQFDMGRIEQMSFERFQNPLPVGQSILIVGSYLTLIVALTLLCFGISYLTFMRQEVRSL